MTLVPMERARRGGGLVAAIRRIGTAAVFGALPLAVLGVVLAAGWARGPFLYDFHGGLYQAGTDLLAGADPYRGAYLAGEAAILAGGGSPETVIDVAVYPAPALVAAIPFALLPYPVAGALFVALSAAALVVALRVLGVRDWRCYGVLGLLWPVVHGLMLGAATPLLVLAAALVWRHRDRAVAAAVPLAAAVAGKLFLWPLAVWLAATGRRRAAALALGGAAAAAAVSWTAIGFTGLRTYPAMLADLSAISQGVGVSPVAAAMALGLPGWAARAAAAALAVALLGAGAREARRGRPATAFALVLVAALAASPMVWPHYLALLVVPVALASPRLSPAWAVLLLADVAPVAQTGAHPVAIVPYLAMQVLAVVAVARAERRALAGTLADAPPLRRAA